MGSAMNEKGLTLIELLLITPFCLYFLFLILTVGGYFIARDVVSYAAREAARQAATPPVTVGYNSPGWQRAVENVSRTLPANVSVPGVSAPHKAFDPVNSNPFIPDVVVNLSGGYVTATVTYHLITPAPGIAKLLDPNAGWLQPYIDVRDTASFKAEV